MRCSPYRPVIRHLQIIWVRGKTPSRKRRQTRSITTSSMHEQHACLVLTTQLFYMIYLLCTASWVHTSVGASSSSRRLRSTSSSVREKPFMSSAVMSGPTYSRSTAQLRIVTAPKASGGDGGADASTVQGCGRRVLGRWV